MNNITVIEKQFNYLEDVVYNGLNPSGISVGGGGGSESDLYYSKVQLDAGQLDNRYYIKAEVNTWRNNVTSIEMGYLHGATPITSNVQTQITNRAIISGSPADSQLAVWTGATSIEGSNNLVFTATGLGIGTTSPTYTLDVCKAVAYNYVAHIINTTAAANRPSALLVETTYTSTTGADTLFKFKSGSKEVLYGNHNGNVGIGTTTPSYGFDANCTGRFTGNFHANNSRFYAAGAVELDYNTVKKFETTSAGVNIIGAAYANTDDKLFDEGDEAWQTSTATNPTWNMATSRNFEWTMASSGTLTISNGANGNSGVLILRANGAYTATLPASSTPASLVVTADNNVLAVYTKLNNGNYIWSSHTFLDPV